MTQGENGPQPDRIDIKGQSDKTILIIAGVHGHEQSGIEVVRRLIYNLHNAINLGLPPTKYSLTIIPILFPVNSARAQEYFAIVQNEYLKNRIKTNYDNKSENFDAIFEVQNKKIPEKVPTKNVGRATVPYRSVLA